MAAPARRPNAAPQVLADLREVYLNRSEFFASLFALQHGTCDPVQAHRFRIQGRFISPVFGNRLPSISSPADEVAAAGNNKFVLFLSTGKPKSLSLH